MNKFYIVISLLTATGIILGYLFFPNESDTALMYLESNRNIEAINRYKAYMRISGDTSSNVIVPLSRVYLKSGRTKEAILLIREYLKKHPDSVEAKRILGQYFTSSHRPADFLLTMEEIATLEPTEKIYRELLDLYLNKGDSYSVSLILNQLVHKKKIAAQESDYRTLIYYYAVRYEYDQGVYFINKLLDDTNGTIKEFSTMDLVVSVLVNAGYKERAFKQAQSFITSNNNLNEKIKIASIFRYSDSQKAIKLLNSLYVNYPDNTKILLTILNIRLDNNENKQVYELLKKLYSEGNTSEGIIDLFTILALENKDYHLVNDVLGRISAEKFRNDTLLEMSQLLFKGKKSELSQKLMSNLGNEFIKDYPLINLLLVGTKDGESFTKIVRHALNNKYYLTDAQKLLFADLLYIDGSKSESFKLLESLPLLKVVTTFQTDIFVELIINQGDITKYLSEFKTLCSKKNEDFDIQTAQAYVMLAAGTGNQKLYSKIISDFKNDDKDYELLIRSAYFVATANRKKKMALDIALKLNVIDPLSHINRLCLLEAYLLNSQYDDAVKLLNAIEIKDKKNEILFLSILTKLVKEKGRQIVLKYSDKYNLIINSILNSPTSSPEARRTVAYFLTDIGDNKRAIKLFLSLAKNAEYDSPDVEQLIYLSSKNPNVEVIKWIQNRVSDSNGTEKRFWLSVLNKIGKSELVIELVDEIKRNNKFRNSMLQYIGNRKRGYKINNGNMKNLDNYIDIYLTALNQANRFESYTKNINSYSMDDYKEFPVFQRLKLILSLFNAGYYFKAYELFKTVDATAIVKKLDPVLVVNVFLKNDKLNSALLFFEKYYKGIYAETVRYKFAKALLYAASGNEEKLFKWIHSLTEKDEIRITETYYIANDYKNYKLALKVAEFLFLLNNSQRNKQLFFESLLENKMYEQVLNYLDLSISKGFEMKVCLVALGGLVKTHDRYFIVKKYSDIIDNVYLFMINDDYKNKEHLRQFGYLLTEIDMLKKARRIFFKLAYDEPVSSSDVEQFIYLLNGKADSEVTEWLRKRAMESTGMDLVKWCRFLNQTNNSLIVIEILERKEL